MWAGPCLFACPSCEEVEVELCEGLLSVYCIAYAVEREFFLAT